MPTRRRFVAAALGSSATASLAGCLTDLGVARTGFLQVKAISVSWRYEGSRRQDRVLLATSDGETELNCRIAEEYEGIVGSVADIRVTDEMERRILRDFADATYVAGFCWSVPGGRTCRNPQATRETFNAVQFGDRAEFVFDAPNVEVIDVYEGAQGDPEEWNAEVQTFDFGALHEEDGVPIE